MVKSVLSFKHLFILKQISTLRAVSIPMQEGAAISRDEAEDFLNAPKTHVEKQACE